MNFNDYIKTYEDLSKQVGGMVLVNEIAIRPIELINGDLEDEISSTTSSLTTAFPSHFNS